MLLLTPLMVVKILENLKKQTKKHNFVWELVQSITGYP